MLYFVQSNFDRDLENYQELLDEFGDAHREYLKQRQDRILVRGPTFDENKEPDSSIMVADFENVEQLKVFLEEEPYAVCGIINEFIIRTFEKRYPIS